MQIVGLKTLTVLNEYVISIRACITRFYYTAISRCIDWRASGGSVVRSSVGALSLVDWVQAIWIEARTDSCEVEGSL